MQKENLVTTLKELGFNSYEIKDILLYALNTKDRQEQMLAWLLSNKGACTKESVRQKAQEILQGVLAANPYNVAAINMPVPKWEPPLPPKTASVAITKKQPAQKSQVPTVKEEKSPIDEDPFDCLIRIFANKQRA